MEFQLELFALGVLLAKELYLFLGDLVPCVFDGVGALVLGFVQIFGVFLFEFLEFSSSVLVALENDLVLHLVFIRPFFKLPLLSLDSADLVKVFLLQLRAFFLGLLDHSDFCLLLAFDSDDLGLKHFLLLLDNLLVGVVQSVDLTLMSFFLLPQPMLEVGSEVIQSFLHVLDRLFVLPMKSDDNILVLGLHLCQAILILPSELLLHTVPVFLTILDVLSLPFNKLLLPLAVILHILMSFAF